MSKVDHLRKKEKQLSDTKEDRAKALDRLSTLCDFFQNRVRLAPNDEALREFDKKLKKWISFSYLQVSQKINDWQKGFASLSLKKGSRVAMLLPNGVNAVCFDQAALANSLVPVPLHAIDTPASSAYILQDSGSEVLVTNNMKRWKEISEAGFDISKIKKVILTEDNAPVGQSLIVSLTNWLNEAKKIIELPEPPKAEDLAAIVYTSGTTGKPKGVMLTHKNVASNVRSTLAHVKPEIGAIFLSFLPLSHTFERTAGYYLALATGSTIVFNRSLQYLAEDFKVVKPNVMISVPRVYERIYSKVNTSLAKKGKIASKIFNSSVAIGWRNFCKKNRIPYNEKLSMSDFVLGKLFFGKISNLLQSQFGGRLAVAISGGAALNNRVARVFCGLGLPIIPGYGMTETSPIICGNKVEDNNPDTVGRLLKDVEVRLGDQNEIQVKGDLVMKGYWNRPEDTAKTFTSDGWLRTGDVGAFDEAGRLNIKGRIKEIIVTSTGEKISPVDLENAIEVVPLINQAYVFGDGFPYIAALLSLDREQWEQKARELGLDPKDPASLDDQNARHMVLQIVKKCCQSFPAYAVPKNVCLTLDAWTIDNGLLTPTLKLKRGPMMQKYGEKIQALYRGARK